MIISFLMLVVLGMAAGMFWTVWWLVADLFGGRSVDAAAASGMDRSQPLKNEGLQLESYGSEAADAVYAVTQRAFSAYSMIGPVSRGSRSSAHARCCPICGRRRLAI